MNPYRIAGPASISFSGGRSSGYMLRQILDAHDDRLPDDVIVQFANTGKEMPQTLDFVEECAQRWSVPIRWVEYVDAEAPADRWTIVDHASAARAGEPFAAVIRRKNYLPNPVTRFCTSELKIKAMSRAIRKIECWDEWTSVVGIRADEPRRVAKLSIPNRDRDERFAPMALAGIDAATVGAFWERQPFDLRLPNNKGRTMHGNCDLCFLKAPMQTMSLIREDPQRAVWWAEQERAAEPRVQQPMMARFRHDRPGYGAMLQYARDQTEIEMPDDALDDCACTD